MSSSVQKANRWKEFEFLLESNSLWVFWYSFSDSFLCSIALCVSMNANRWPRSVKYFVYIPAKLMATYSSVLATICLTTHDESMHGSSSLVFWNLVNVVMMMWVIAVMVPPIMHHLSGSGSIAYGTKRVNRMYQTRYSRSAKPIPSPTKPEWGTNKLLLANYKQHTLEVEQQPCARCSPMEIIIGEASPQAQHADSQVGENAKNRPRNGINWNTL